MHRLARCLVVAGSRGNLFAPALNAIDSTLGMDFWQAMPMPAVYRLHACPAGWRILPGTNVVEAGEREFNSLGTPPMEPWLDTLCR